MSHLTPDRSLRLLSLVRPDQTLELFIEEVQLPEPGPGEVVIRVEASPINPSDLGLLFAGAEMAGAVVRGTSDRPVVTAPMPEAGMRAAAARVGIPMPVGNEGAGIVVAAGGSQGARALLDKTVAVPGGGMYAQYRCVDAAACLELPEGTSAADGASSFVNPMTTLAMVETMRREGHQALVHTAAASNLGQMLNRLCVEEQVPLVNVVRSVGQVELLKTAGATYVCDSSSPSFTEELAQALTKSSATLAFDAIGGGQLASRILAGMETAASTGSGYNRYGSSTHKQVYIYGSLDRGPTELNRSFGMAWGVGGWLLTPRLQNIGPEATAELRRRVAAGLKTTFASSYAAEVSLAGALQLEAISVYGRQTTGSKYLINPNR
ncbi:MAG: zinc-binding dehydrogenase [Acidimicrobiales bacterium]